MSIVERVVPYVHSLALVTTVFGSGFFLYKMGKAIAQRRANQATTYGVIATVGMLAILRDLSRVV